jgi:galactoside O-acetyltransferase
MGFLSKTELNKIGFKSLGNNVFISDKASFYSPGTIIIGSNVRIDDFCILSGNIKLGNYIHISAYCGLYGKGGIEMGNFSGLSPRCTLLSASDDFSGQFMISPMVSEEFTNVQFGKIKIGEFAQIGAGTVLLPNVNIAKGSVVGAMSLVKKNTEEWKIYGGTPAKFLKHRKKNLKDLSKRFLKED